MTNKILKFMLGLAVVGLLFGLVTIFFRANPDSAEDLPYGLSDPVDGFAPSPTPEIVIQDVTWNWISFTDPKQTYDVEMPENYTVIFNSDLTVNIKADCNVGNSTYTFDETGSVMIEPIFAMTRAFCPPESRSDEFITHLINARIYFTQETDLFLDLMADGGTMKFSELEIEN